MVAAEGVEPGLPGGMVEDDATQRKWFFAVLLACPPCFASGLAVLGTGVAGALTIAGWLLLGLAVLLVTVAAVAWARRRPAACGLPR